MVRSLNNTLARLIVTHNTEVEISEKQLIFFLPAVIKNANEALEAHQPLSCGALVLLL